MRAVFNSHYFKQSTGKVLFLLLAGVVFSVCPQVPLSMPAGPHGVVLTAIRSDSLVLRDSTLPVTVVAENKGATVVEAIVSLVDSASGDTLENWYPLFPPESADSIVLFWNTRGAKPGRHTLTAVLAAPPDNNFPPVRLSRILTIVR